MQSNASKYTSQNKLTEHRPQMNTQLDSQVRRILQGLSQTKGNQLKITHNSYHDSIFALKLAKYDPEAQQKRKFQLRNQFSPQKWKVSTNKNSEFSQSERVKGKILTGWDMQRANMSKRSYQNPKQFHGLKADLFSREFPKDLSKTYSKGFNKKLKQIQSEYEKKVFEGNVKTIEQKRQKSIDAIRSRGTKFQLSKDKLFGFVTPVKSAYSKDQKLRNTISHFYQSEGSAASKNAQ